MYWNENIFYLKFVTIFSDPPKYIAETCSRTILMRVSLML